MALVDLMRGEDVRNGKWFNNYTTKLIEKYVRFKNNSKDGDFLIGQIAFYHRAKRILKPKIKFIEGEDGEDIRLDLEE